MRIILSIVACALLASCVGARGPSTERIPSLSKMQNKNGSWGKAPEHRHVLTSLVLMMYLSNGETPFSETHGQAIVSATKWLLANTDSVPTQKDDPNYKYLPADVIVAIALTEFRNMTQMPKAGEAAKKALAGVLKRKRYNLWLDNLWHSTRPEVATMKQLAQVAKLATPAGRPKAGLETAQIAAATAAMFPDKAETDEAKLWVNTMLKTTLPDKWDELGGDWPMLGLRLSSEAMFSIHSCSLYWNERPRCKEWRKKQNKLLSANFSKGGYLDVPAYAQKRSAEAKLFRNATDRILYASAMGDLSLSGWVRYPLGCPHKAKVDEKETDDRDRDKIIVID